MNIRFLSINRFFKLYKVIYIWMAVLVLLYGALGLLSFLFVGDKPIDQNLFKESINQFIYLAFVSGKFFIWYKISSIFSLSCDFYSVFKGEHKILKIGKLLFCSFVIDVILEILFISLALGPSVNWENIHMPAGNILTSGYVLGLIPFFLKWSLVLSKFLLININGLPALLLGCICYLVKAEERTQQL